MAIDDEKRGRLGLKRGRGACGRLVVLVNIVTVTSEIRKGVIL